MKGAGSVVSPGSSPLARGLPVDEGGDGRPRGIIPARAGFTCRFTRSSPRRRDHPRSRGVYGHGVVGDPVPDGSSPLARGLHALGDEVIIVTRIIPARAGFTSSTWSPTWSTWDHPRSRGVYVIAAHARFPVSGIIPARAGFTKRSTPPTRPIKDHPRSRGVYREIRGDLYAALGSSPLARGLPPSRSCDHARRRIIPARAGFTVGLRGLPAGGPDHPRSRGVYVS